MISLVARHGLGALLFAFMALSAFYSADTFGLRQRFPPPATAPRPPPASAGAGIAQAEPVRRSHPWWQPLRTFTGAGPATTEAFAIDDHAIQWKVAWRCQHGSLRLQPHTPGGGAVGHDLADGSCPQEGEGYSVAAGRFALVVAADGPWQADVAQQVDTPLVEPLLPTMVGAPVLARGDFYDIDKTGEGTVTVYRLPDGTAALRLDDFYVTPTVDLEIRLSALPAPQSTAEVTAAPFEDVTFLTATTGAMNYVLAPGLDLARYQSVVIWCEPLAQAYAAAALRR